MNAGAAGGVTWGPASPLPPEPEAEAAGTPGPPEGWQERGVLAGGAECVQKGGPGGLMLGEEEMGGERPRRLGRGGPGRALSPTLTRL